MIDPLQLVGARPFGNPASMRAAARVVSHQAHELEQRAAHLQGRVHGVLFEGPAGSAFRGRMAGALRDLRAEAQTLHQVAALLNREAGLLERRQQDWNNRFAAAKRKVAELAREAARRAAR